jgi:hypothetical protein
MLNRFDQVEPIGTATGDLPPYAHWAEGDALVGFDDDG